MKFFDNRFEEFFTMKFYNNIFLEVFTMKVFTNIFVEIRCKKLHCKTMCTSEIPHIVENFRPMIFNNANFEFCPKLLIKIDRFLTHISIFDQDF